VQEDGQGIFVRTPNAAGLVPGDRVRVQGTTQPSFRPFILGDSVTFLRHGKPPEPMPATFDDLVRTKFMCMLVRVRGVVRTADPMSIQKMAGTRLQMLVEGGYVDVEVESRDAGAIKDLLDAEVEVSGIGGRQFDSKVQQTGVILHVSTFANIKILKRADASPWSLPVLPMDEIITGIHVRDLSQRLRIHGTITYYQPGSGVVLQNGARSLWVSTNTDEPLGIGDVADATGFPDSRNRRLALTHAEIQDSHMRAPIPPLPATWHQLAFWENNKPYGHEYDLVSIEGQVVTEVREAAQDEYVLVAGQRLFTAIYRHPPSPLPLPSMLEVPLGSKVRVTGICMMEDYYPLNNEVSFNILIRSFDDIEFIARPSLLNVRNLMILVALLLAVMLVVVVRGWVLERRVHGQALTMTARTEIEAGLERRRSRILEDINGAKPLASIVEEIAQLVSYRLEGAPCWCEITEGARLGRFPAAANSLHIICQEIPARSGPPLGRLCAAFKPDAPLTGAEKEALLVGARLATLAIETRRMNADLLHRSEFDQLTDIHNRFSLGKRVDAQIKTARLNAAIFGLIYVDLDEFKQVNDRYGHHIGDLYLQEIAGRMKLQLRSQDLLARLGGDEFVALLPTVRNRADVEEISQRLEHCFKDPLVLETYTLKGSASFGIALYPEDSDTTDGLLSAADAAMYKAKHHKRGFVSLTGRHRNPEGESRNPKSA